MDMTTAFWYAAGIIVLLVALQVLATPLQILARVLGSSVVGGIGLFLLNQVGGLVGFHVGLNPVSAVIAGMLGVPGVVGLSLISLFLS